MPPDEREWWKGFAVGAVGGVALTIVSILLWGPR